MTWLQVCVIVGAALGTAFALFALALCRAAANGDQHLNDEYAAALVAASRPPDHNPPRRL